MIQPEQIHFNRFKHHLGHIRRRLSEGLTSDWIMDMNILCNNNIDIYSGGLTEEEIIGEILSELNHYRITSQEVYLEWIDRVPKYRLIPLSDDSHWILLKGNEDQKPVHIHPAKTGKHTIRFKGSTLKTLYGVRLINPGLQSAPALDLVNRGRTMVGLPPVKSLEPGKGILKCWNTIF